MPQVVSVSLDYLCRDQWSRVFPLNDRPHHSRNLVEIRMLMALKLRCVNSQRTNMTKVWRPFHQSLWSYLKWMQEYSPCLTDNPLGYEICQGVTKPFPPENLKPQRRAGGLSEYYSCQIPQFSDPIHPLAHNSVFPLLDQVKRAFETLKFDHQSASVTAVEPSSPLLIEKDASDIPIAAALIKMGDHWPFFEDFVVEWTAPFGVCERSLHYRRVCPQVVLLSAQSSLHSEHQSMLRRIHIWHASENKNRKWKKSVETKTLALPFRYHLLIRPGKSDHRWLIS